MSTGSNPPPTVAPSFVLRFQSPEDYPIIGRFADDDFDLSRVTKPTNELWDMYYEDENLKEEIAPEELVRDAEYYKKKRKQRRSYRRKQRLLLESLTKSNLFEARPVALDSAEEEYYKRIAKNWSSSTKDGQPNASASASSGSQFRNVLLKFVKIEGSNQSEIHVIPVSDQYNFRKCIRQPDRLLDDIDAERAQEAAIMKKRAQAYNRLLNSGEDGKQDNSDNQNAKARRAKAESGAGGGAEDGFTYALNRAMRKHAGKNMKKSSTSTFLTDSGVDMDEIRENNHFFGNDSSVRYQDDEEDNIHEILKNDQSFEEREREDDFRLEAMDELEGLSSEDEMDEDEDGENAKGGASGKSELSPAELRSIERARMEQQLQNAVRQGTENVSTAMLREAAENRRLIIEKNAAMGIEIPGTTTSSSSSGVASSAPPLPTILPTKSTLKRPRDDITATSTSSATAAAAASGDTDGDLPPSKVPRARFGQDVTTSVVQFDTSAPSMAVASTTTTSSSSTAGSTSASAAAVASFSSSGDSSSNNNNIISEDVIRQYIINQGGRVSIERFVTHCSALKKRYIKANGGGKPAKEAANASVTSILNKITGTVDDAELGPCIVLI